MHPGAWLRGVFVSSADAVYVAVGVLVTAASLVGLHLKGKAPPKGDKLR